MRIRPKDGDMNDPARNYLGVVFGLFSVELCCAISTPLGFNNTIAFYFEILNS